jgi:hypothetical protein
VRCVEVMCAGVPHTSAHKGIYYGEGHAGGAIASRGLCPTHLARALREGA